MMRARNPISSVLVRSVLLVGFTALVASACFPPPSGSTRTTTTIEAEPVVPSPSSFVLRDLSLDLERAVPECDDGLDNDSDGATDHPADSSCTTPTDDSELIAGHPWQQLSITGSYTPNGTVTVESADAVFPTVWAQRFDPVFGLLPIGLQLRQVGKAIGSVDVDTGEVSLLAQLQIAVSAPDITWVNGCVIGGANGFTVELTTATTTPPAPADPLTGTPFTGPASVVGLVSNDFSIPSLGLSACATHPFMLEGSGPLINGLLGLPAAAGLSELHLRLTLDPA